MGKKFEDKVVVITGSSAGIGRAAALLFAEEGAKIVLHGQCESRIQETYNLLIRAGCPTGKIAVVRGSLEHESVIHTIIDKTIEKFGKIDVLVNNGASGGKRDCSDTMSLENFDYLIKVNLRSAIQLTMLALPYLSKTKGNIVNVSSISSVKAAPEYPYYSVCKAGLDHYTRTCAVMYAPEGIRVNSILPGATRTNMLMAVGFSAEESDKRFAETRCGFLGRPAEAREIGVVIRFLASDDASHITGAALPVDGGATTNPLSPLIGQQD